MKKHLVFIAVLFLIAVHFVKVSGQNEVNTNKNAPPNYDARLKAGDRAVASH